jgi:hypothetical protein
MGPTAAWFVAFNTAQNTPAITQLAGGNINPDTPAGYESLHAGNLADNAKFLAAAAATKVGGPFAAGKGPVISVENVKWANVNGPYATQAQANAAIPAIQKAEPAPGAASEAEQAATSAISNPLDYLEDVGDFFHRLTEAATWERVGEIGVGVLLLYIGVKALTQNTAVGNGAKKSHTTGKKIIEALAVPK